MQPNSSLTNVRFSKNLYMSLEELDSLHNMRATDINPQNEINRKSIEETPIHARNALELSPKNACRHQNTKRTQKPLPNPKLRVLGRDEAILRAVSSER